MRSCRRCWLEDVTVNARIWESKWRIGAFGSRYAEVKARAKINSAEPPHRLAGFTVVSVYLPR